tara:strand:- start:409 stop:597 length:189 start_codon:yes stop_codon:yes gene_type:complete
MLILTRKSGEHITLVQNGEEIARFTVIERKGRQVRFGVLAKDDIDIHREPGFLEGVKKLDDI